MVEMRGIAPLSVIYAFENVYKHSQLRSLELLFRLTEQAIPVTHGFG